MIYNAQNGNLKIDNTDMNYISFGNGKRILVVIPGLVDGLKTTKGMALPFAYMYRRFAKDFTVYMFSRKNQLEEGYSTRDMARDCVKAMQQLGIEKADVMGISQGGMVAQYVAIDFPEVVNKLILTVTISRKNEIIEPVINSWIGMAKCGNYKAVMSNTMELMYSEKWVSKVKWLYPLICKVSHPKDFSRYLIMAKACLTHHAYDKLDKIQCPTLVVGAENDKVLSGGASVEIADKIKDCKLFMYKGYGHGVYEEAKDFDDRVSDFLLASS